MSSPTNDQETVFADTSPWKRISGYGSRRFSQHSSGLPAVVIHEFPGGETLRGRCIAFFSDLHWRGPGKITEGLASTINRIFPDWLVFGGDIATYSCHVEDALRFMAALDARIGKISVFGNWERKRHSWQSTEFWKKKYRDSGFTLLVNEHIIFPGLAFFGSDSYLKGMEVSRFPVKKTGTFNCLVTHAADTVIEHPGSDQILERTDLVLSGHTHAGQIRMPLFGAIRTSSRYWKKFEYGLFKNERHMTRMIVTSGVGTNWIPLRIFCDPEIVLVKFT